MKSFVIVSSGFWSQAAAGTLPFASALESHWSVLEIALPDDLSLLPSHLSARAIAGCRSNVVATDQDERIAKGMHVRVASQVSPRERVAHGAR